MRKLNIEDILELCSEQDKEQASEFLSLYFNDTEQDRVEIDKAMKELKQEEEIQAQRDKIDTES